MPEFVLPGDSIQTRSTTLKLGPGLLKTHDAPGARASGSSGIVSTRAGTLHHDAKGVKWWIESNAQRYVPAAQEGVIGVVSQKAGEGYRVDIGSAHAASLDGLAFEGASKRNKPTLKIGSLVYARISLAHKDMEPELQCFDAQTRKAEGYGELKGGFMTKCSLGTARTLLLDETHYLLPLLGSVFPLEVVVGVNGRIWVKTPEPKQTIAAIRCIDLFNTRSDISVAAMRQFLGSLET
ncbi:exosome complex exonuclease RRP40 [Auriculariales sp. MPI-PUGE-AT-0066]|nr:exosome complex exonuclease RRP40 [Auriculariales sp. MPI-PUGE-AT-0066]